VGGSHCSQLSLGSEVDFCDGVLYIFITGFTGVLGKEGFPLHKKEVLCYLDEVQIQMVSVVACHNR
jgi:hypothetical protein